MTYKTREDWLQAFTQHPATQAAFAGLGAPIPAQLRIGVGWTNKGARAKAIGECYSTVCSGDGTWEIIMSPVLAEGSRVADVLIHELVHASVGLECGHKGAFTRVAKGLGLEGKMTATIAGAGWHAWADDVVAELGDYPHAMLDGALSSGPKKQGTRMLKVYCGCGYQVRASRKWLEVAMPDCPVCRTVMTCDDMGDDDELEEMREAA